MAKLTRTYCYAATLSSSAHRDLDGFLHQQRILYNGALQERKDCYERTGETITLYDQFKSLTQIRKEDGWFSIFPVDAQRSVRNLDKGYKAFFRRVKEGDKPGFPRYKGYGRVRSFEQHNPSIKSNEKWHWVNVKGGGQFKFRGELKGNPKMLRIVRKPRRVEVLLVCEHEIARKEDKRPPVGIDLGVKARATLSNGMELPKRLLDRTKLKAKQRKVSKAVKWSNTRQKKVNLLAKEWQRVAESERDYLHRFTSWVMKEVSSKFVVEDLKIENMVRNHKLARAILEQNWGAFVELLTYKAESAGGWVMKVPPHNTSQLCSECHAFPDEKIRLDVRTYECAHCGHVENRDVNAAKNILQVGLSNPPGGNIPGAWGEGSRLRFQRRFKRSITTQNSVERLREGHVKYLHNSLDLDPSRAGLNDEHSRRDSQPFRRGRGNVVNQSRW